MTQTRKFPLESGEWRRPRSVLRYDSGVAVIREPQSSPTLHKDPPTVDPIVQCGLRVADRFFQRNLGACLGNFPGKAAARNFFLAWSVLATSPEGNLRGVLSQTERRHHMLSRATACHDKPIELELCCAFRGFSLNILAIGVSVFRTIPARMWGHRDLSSSSASLRAVATSCSTLWNLVLNDVGFWIAATLVSAVCRARLYPPAPSSVLRELPLLRHCPKKLSSHRPALLPSMLSQI